MSEVERRQHQRFDIERTLRAVANGELRLGRVKELSSQSAAIHLDQPLEEGTQITLDIEDLGSFSGHVAGPPRDGIPALDDPRVIVTPHAAFFSEESVHQLRVRTSRQVAAKLTGGAVENVVNAVALGGGEPG